MVFAAASSGLTLVLFVTGLFVVFTPLPLAFTVIRKGVWNALLLTAAVLGVLVSLYLLPKDPFAFLPMMIFYPSVPLRGILGLSVIYFSYYLLLGWVVALASRSRGRLEPTVAWISLLGLSVPALALAAYSYLVQINFLQDIVAGLHGLFQRMIDIQQSSGLAEEDVAFLKASAPMVVMKFLQVLPALWIVLTLCVLSLNILFLRRWSRGVKLFPKWPDFGLWRLKEAWIWAPIAVGATYFLNLYLVHSEVAEIAANNVLIVLGAVYFFQGLAVASYFFKTRFSPWLRLIGYLLFLIFFQVGVVVIMGVGLADFWFDFRKLKKIA